MQKPLRLSLDAAQRFLLEIRHDALGELQVRYRGVGLSGEYAARILSLVHVDEEGHAAGGEVAYLLQRTLL